LIDDKYLSYFLKSPIYWKAISEKRLGIAVPNVNASKLKQICVPVSPLFEQHRIVARIEELFSNLDAGVEALQKAKSQLQRYRQSVLKAAVEGKLTEEWRKEHPDVEPAEKLLERMLQKRKCLRTKQKQPDAPVAVELRDLPKGWTWASLDQLSWSSSYGTSEKCDYDYKGMPVIRIPNIVNGSINLIDIKYTSNSSNIKNSEPLSYGDLLVIRTNGSKDLIGRGAVVSQDFDKPYFFASYLIRFRLTDVDTLPLWIGGIFHSPRIRRWIERAIATSAGQYNISMSTLNKLPIEIPPTEEQQIILGKIENLLNVAEETQKTLNESAINLDNLRQSILKTAFEGNLVPQDPNDEPASMLLERIKAERDTTRKGKRSNPMTRQMRLIQ
jgi:type I restriction enzyme S subunit